MKIKKPKLQLSMTQRELKKFNPFEWLGIVILMIIAINVGLIVRNNLFSFLTVRQSSMSPTIRDGEKITVVQFLPWKQFDIVIISDPSVSENLLLKRVVAVGGQWLEIRDNHLYIYEMKNGKEQEKVFAEDYIAGQNIELEKTFVEEGTVFVLGDNRLFSLDSQEFGAISEESIIAKLVFNNYGRPKLIS